MNIVHRVMNNRQNVRQNFLELVPFFFAESVDEFGEAGGECVDFAIAQMASCRENPGSAGFRSFAYERLAACGEGEGESATVVVR